MKKLRKRAGLTQAQIARELEIAESTVRNWDQGRTLPRLNALEYPKLLDLLKSTPIELANAALGSFEEFQKKEAKS